MAKRRHIWITSKGHPDYCTMCGVDRTPQAVKQGCRPTRIAGL